MVIVIFFYSQILKAVIAHESALKAQAKKMSGSVRCSTFVASTSIAEQQTSGACEEHGKPNKNPEQIGKAPNQQSNRHPNKQSNKSPTGVQQEPNMNPTRVQQ